MSNYKFIKLNELCTKITDGSHYSPKGIDVGVPMLSVKDMKNNSFDYSDCKYISNEDYLDLIKSECKPLLNDILIAKDGSYLKHVFVIKNEIDQAVLSSIGILRPNLKKVIPQYIKYYLQTKSVKETVAKKYVSGSALPRIILKNFGEIDVVYKDIQTQQKIASVLSSLDDKIELNNRINSELEAMAKTLYDYWFVQFDFPNEEGKPYKTSGGAMVWNEELKREIPEGWEVCLMNNLLIKYSDKSEHVESKQILNRGKYPVITQDNGNFIAGFSNSENPSQDVPLIVFGDHSCTLRYVDFPFFRGADGTQLLLFSENMVIYMFLYLQKVINQIPGYGKYERHYKYLKEFKIIVPSSKSINEFQKIVNPLFEKLSKSRFENQKLSELRDWLLPMLLNGQVKVG